MQIDGRKIGAHHPPYIIAEVSANHNGSIEKALETIRVAAECGADAVKIQTYTPDTMTIDCDKDEFMIEGGLWDGRKLYELYQEAHTPFEWHGQMFDLAKELNLTLFSTPFDETAADFLEGFDVPCYKIASFENTDYPLIEYVARKGKPMIISTGMASFEEIDGAMQAVRRGGDVDVILLHCISSYPAPIAAANIGKMHQIRDRYGVEVGLSDHTLGVTVSVAASALGACAIEKHFILSREDDGPDSSFSIEPEELRSLCRDSRDSWASVGSADQPRSAEEIQSRTFRRSIYFMRDLPAGHIVTEEDIRRIRPGYGLPPKMFGSLIGKRLRVGVTRGEATRMECFDE